MGGRKRRDRTCLLQLQAESGGTFADVSSLRGAAPGVPRVGRTRRVAIAASRALLKKVDYQLLKKVDYIDFFINKVVEQLKLIVINKCPHQSQNDNVPYCVTVIYLLSESHLSIHTFVDEGKVAINLFTCS